MSEVIPSVVIAFFLTKQHKGKRRRHHPKKDSNGSSNVVSHKHQHKKGLDIRNSDTDEHSGFVEDDELDLFGLGSDKVD